MNEAIHLWIQFIRVKKPTTVVSLFLSGPTSNLCESSSYRTAPFDDKKGTYLPSCNWVALTRRPSDQFNLALRVKQKL